MIARPSVSALTECRALLDTIATTPARAIWVASSDGYLELALNRLVDFFLWMVVLVNGRAPHEVVMRERHALRMEIALVPARQALNDIEAANVNKWHTSPLKAS